MTTPDAGRAATWTWPPTTPTTVHIRPLDEHGQPTGPWTPIPATTVTITTDPHYYVAAGDHDTPICGACLTTPCPDADTTTLVTAGRVQATTTHGAHP